MDSVKKIIEIEGVKPESNGAIPVNVQDQNTRSLDLIFSKESSSTTITVAASKGDQSITLSNTTGFEDGKYIHLIDGDNFYTGFQVGSPVGNEIVNIDLCGDVLVIGRIGQVMIDQVVDQLLVILQVPCYGPLFIVVFHR